MTPNNWTDLITVLKDIDSSLMFIGVILVSILLQIAFHK